MQSVQTFEYGIPRCTCLYLHAHIPWAWRVKLTPSSKSSIKKQKKQLNLANCAPTVTVIYRTFYGIIFCVKRVLDIGVMRPSKFPINLRYEVRSKTNRGVYDSSHIRIVSSSNCNSLRDLVVYDFIECVNTCMIPFEEVGVFSILTNF